MKKNSKYEREDVHGLMWRKLVDMSLLDQKASTLPEWIRSQWRINSLFKNINKQSDPKSKIQISFNKKTYTGSITYENRNKHNRSPLYRMWFPKELQDELKSAFVMTYMRSIEEKIRKKYKTKDAPELRADEDIPFNEFVDIEYLGQKKFKLTAHYVQRPSFKYLFRSFIESHVLQRIEQDLSSDFKDKIIKKSWMPKSELKGLGESPTNVIYYLLDSKNKYLYIGEAQDLLKRVKENRSEIPHWDYFRYDVLPSSYSSRDRLEIEKMTIKSFSYLMKKNKSAAKKAMAQSFEPSFTDFVLANRKIDK